MRTMTVTVLSTDGTTLPHPFTVTVPKCGRSKDLIQALSIACSLKNDERLLVAEVNSNSLMFNYQFLTHRIKFCYLYFWYNLTLWLICEA